MAPSRSVSFCCCFSLMGSSSMSSSAAAASPPDDLVTIHGLLLFHCAPPDVRRWWRPTNPIQFPFVDPWYLDLFLSGKVLSSGSFVINRMRRHWLRPVLQRWFLFSQGFFWNHHCHVFDLDVVRNAVSWETRQKNAKLSMTNDIIKLNLDYSLIIIPNSSWTLKHHPGPLPCLKGLHRLDSRGHHRGCIANPLDKGHLAPDSFPQACSHDPARLPKWASWPRIQS